MAKFSRQWAADMGERALWTAAEGGLAVAATAFGDLQTQWAVPIMAALVFLKSIAARHIGDSDSAATLPASNGVEAKG